MTGRFNGAPWSYRKTCVHCGQQAHLEAETPRKAHALFKRIHTSARCRRNQEEVKR